MSPTFKQPSSASESSDTTSPKSTFRLASAPPPLRVQYSTLDSPIKRKPLPPGAIPVNLDLRTSLSSSLKSPPYDSHPAVTDSFLDEPIRAPILFDRSGSQDSPTLPPPGGFVDVENPDSVIQHLEYNQSPKSSFAWRLQQRDFHPPHYPPSTSLATHGHFDALSPPKHARITSDTTLLNSPQFQKDELFPAPRRPSAVAMTAITANPNIHLPDDNDESNKGSGFKSFFKWGGNAAEQTTTTITTTISDRGPSPSLSPKAATSLSYLKMAPTMIDTTSANAGGLGPSGPLSAHSILSFAPSTLGSIEAIEEEVRAISADLAASIRREMDLEDLVDRLQAETQERGGNGRRTSDYFSDAGTPVRILDLEPKSEIDTDRVVRKAEQDMAQLRLDMLVKVQEERDKRRVLESHVKDLEDQAVKTERFSSQLVPPNAAGHIRDLENALEDAGRKLAEERQVRENFEDLLSALREELEANRNERDNLRDEVVPQLRARVEGLESEASDLQKLMYEHSRMQQELTNLKSENASLAAAIRNQGRQSQAGSPSGYATPGTPPNGAVSVPLNPKDRESLAERLKDVETQRDALHQALKSLRDRQQFESQKAKDKIKALESERDRALDKNGPRRPGRNRDISALRREVDRLRQRADDALEQKFACERSLGTLKMDLERAEQETSTLRALLQEHDNLVAEHDELSDSHVRLSRQVSELKQGVDNASSSVSLQKAYKDLQEIHERSLERLDELEARGATMTEVTDRERRLSEANEESQKAIQKLRQSLTEAEVDRDSALVEASTYRKRAETLQKAEAMHMTEERSLATQLRISSQRVEELAAQVRSQLASNESLRERLQDCITRGETEQQASADTINKLQNRLKILEDKVVDAQQQAEDAVNQHEDEMRMIKETHTSQLKRLKSAVASPLGSPRTPMSPFLRSPKLEWTSSVRNQPSPDPTKTEFLEGRVTDLERALSDADNEMAEVVGRMNIAQIEVLELQNERDDAVRQTKRLQTDLVTERSKYKGLW